MTQPLPIIHPLYGAGEIIDYRAGEALFAFPGSLKFWESVTPAEAVLSFRSLPLLNTVLGSAGVKSAEIIWRSHRGEVHV